MRMPRTTGDPIVTRADLASEAIGLLLGVTGALRQRVDGGCGQLGLTPAVARALLELDPDHPSPARDLAERLECDRSNVTGLVDKLEDAGLVERRVAPTDRRVKTLVVTAAGRQIQAQMQRLTSDSAELLVELTDAELRTLRDLLGKITTGTH
jgi:DNA-binding MarR family transcriptional regulator